MDTRQETEREQLLGAEPGELDLWSTEESKGWNRLSITRQPGRPPVNPDDLLLPSGLGNARMLAACTGMGLLATFLYVWVPVMLVNFFVAVPGMVLVGLLGGAFLALTMGLYVWGTIETQRDRELGGRL